MNDKEWLDYKVNLRERIKVFSLKVLELSDLLPMTTKGKVINYQITKSGTSVYANYRAALRGRSKAEFYSKLCISVEESDETEMWIELILESKILVHDFVRELHKESLEILKELSSMRKKLSYGKK